MYETFPKLMTDTHKTDPSRSENKQVKYQK